MQFGLQDNRRQNQKSGICCEKVFFGAPTFRLSQVIQQRLTNDRYIALDCVGQGGHLNSISQRIGNDLPGVCSIKANMMTSFVEQ